MEGTAALQAGVVDQDVDGAVAGLNVRHRGFAGVTVGHVEGGLVHGEALGAQRGGGGGQLGGVAAVEHQCGSRLAQATRQRQADARRRAGDKGQAAIEAEGVGSDHGAVDGRWASTVAATWSGEGLMSTLIGPSSAPGGSSVASWLSSSEGGM